MTARSINMETGARAAFTSNVALGNESAILGVFSSLENRTFSQEFGLGAKASPTVGQP